MHIHTAVLQMGFGLFIAEIGVPAIGLIASIILWQRARRRTEGDLPELLTIGFRSIVFAFAAYLIWLSLTFMPRKHDPSFTLLILTLLSISATVGACSGLVLSLLRGRGQLRITGTTLALIALTYALFSGLALLTGRAA